MVVAPEAQHERWSAPAPRKGNRPMRSLNLVLASAAILLAATASAKGQSMIEAGQPFPELVLPVMEDGSPASIAMYRGKKVVLHIFASW